MNDSYDTLSSGQPVVQAENAGGVADVPPPTANPPKPKKKRAPRPTYDDGAITRVFKFPSKKYPKSSYYVTSTDIIIRIKKARKKWKLVVPKKRVASYRTNRWFAKPRWVEIELTYTQAVRLDLVEASTKVAQPTSAELPAEHDVDDVSTFYIASEPDAPDGLDGDLATDCVSADADAVVAESVTQEPPDTAVEALPDQVFVEPVALLSFDCSTSKNAADAIAPPDVSKQDVSSEDFSSQDCSEKKSSKGTPPLPVRRQELPKRRTIEARSLATALAMVILSFSAGWWPLADGSYDNASCAFPTHMSCANHDIVTGSIAVAVPPDDAVVERPVPPQRQALLEDLPASLQSAKTPPFDAPIESAREESALAQPRAAELTGGPNPESRAATESTAASPEEEVALSKEADVGAPYTPPHTVVPLIDQASQDHVRPAEPTIPSKDDIASLESVPPASIDHCPRIAATTAVSTLIQFAFASASIPPQSLEALSVLATTLKQCPAVQMIIEGHTDSDGDFYRNQSLSVRRAEAVRQLLINYGAGAEQLSIVGFGQMRPLVPNDSDLNKRRNRRIELVVE